MIVNNVKYTAAVNCCDMTEDKIMEQISVRRYLISTMIGSLYPQLVSKEIKTLEGIIEKRKYQESWDGMWEIE